MQNSKNKEFLPAFPVYELLQRKELLKRLPEIEQTILELYYAHNMGQKKIADNLKITQGAVSSRISRAKERISALINLPSVEPDQLENDLKTDFSAVEIEIIKTIVNSTCQRETAKIVSQNLNIRLNQTGVRNRLEKCRERLRRLSKEDPKFKIYRTLLLWVKKYPYVLHELKSFKRKHIH